MKTLPPDTGWCGDRRRGASLGRSDRGAPCDELDNKFTLQRLRIDSGGYDQGGAYWGLGEPMWWASCDDIERFFRAPNRASAKEIVREEYPQARFFR